jgi:type II secretory pathway component PulF
MRRGCWKERKTSVRRGEKEEKRKKEKRGAFDHVLQLCTQLGESSGILSVTCRRSGKKRDRKPAFHCTEQASNLLLPLREGD